MVRLPLRGTCPIKNSETEPATDSFSFSRTTRFRDGTQKVATFFPSSLHKVTAAVAAAPGAGDFSHRSGEPDQTPPAQKHAYPTFDAHQFYKFIQTLENGSFYANDGQVLAFFLLSLRTSRRRRRFFFAYE